MVLVKKKKAFTLVEILVVMAILLIMIVILIGILNPIALVNKARDSRRKKDLSRIKVAFEEYYNDKGCYPNDLPPERWITNLMKSENCGTPVFGKWLNPWPCDPNGEAYEIWTGYDDNCPQMFKILTTLENKNDPSINITSVNDGGPNYAVTSGNITAGKYLGDENPNCSSSLCYSVENGQCNQVNICFGPNCFKMGCERTDCQMSNCP